ncbi:MAG TPA: YceI family protein [Flavobacteriales bacterium]|nr:YceI family protein [Flavobacteriales bacterium]
MNLLKTFALSLALAPLTLAAQERYMTRTGHVDFHSSTPIEDIHADNDKVTSVWDATSGAIEFSLLIKAFTFEKALMQEHFNENYMESNKFPKATFKGTLKGVAADQLAKGGSYQVTVEGTINIHGVDQPIKTTGTITVDGKGGIRAESKFQVKPEDHGIKIPGAVRKNIAETMDLNVRMDYTKMP